MRLVRAHCAFATLSQCSPIRHYCPQILQLAPAAYTYSPLRSWSGAVEVCQASLRWRITSGKRDSRCWLMHTAWSSMGLPYTFAGFLKLQHVPA
eukprot:5223721-Pyramimonas_sp.AAC.2